MASCAGIIVKQLHPDPVSLTPFPPPSGSTVENVPTGVPTGPFSATEAFESSRSVGAELAGRNYLATLSRMNRRPADGIDWVSRTTIVRVRSPLSVELTSEVWAALHVTRSPETSTV